MSLVVVVVVGGGGRDGRRDTCATEAEEARQFARADHWASTGEELPNAPRATHRASKRRRKRQAKPVARRCDTSSNEPTGTDKDDASATPRGDSPNTGSEAGSTSAAQAVVEPERDVVGT